MVVSVGCVQLTVSLKWPVRPEPLKASTRLMAVGSVGLAGGVAVATSEGRPLPAELTARTWKA